MPIVLTQYPHDRTTYDDIEGVHYHYPSQYRGAIDACVAVGDHRFIYYRPLVGAPVGQGGTYFGHGIFSAPYPDKRKARHYFVDIMDYHELRPVSLKSPTGRYYETDADRMNFQRAVRPLSEMRYHAILFAGEALPVSKFVLPGGLQDRGLYAPVAPPKDRLRPMLVVPSGAGYVPNADGMIDRYEAAALHERARDDHQDTVELLMRTVMASGGSCEYNNNIDLFAQVGERRMLIEVKSLTRSAVAVNRMRYGMGQLMDYRVRYKAELAGAEPVLAFGTPPDRDASWIPSILQDNGIAFIARAEGSMVAGNDLARTLPIFA